MNRSTITFAALLLLAPTALAVAEDDTDVARGVVDPYDAGDERRRFLAAAGVDGELDENEFKANLAAQMPFARKFDAWVSLKAFDKNNNQSLDWFEADGYRNALRDAVLLTHDKDKDNRLTEGERIAANRELAGGKVPRMKLPGREGAAASLNDWDANGDGKMDDAEREAYVKTQQERQAKWMADYVKKWDEDGDGKVGPEESAKAQKAQWDEWKQKYPEQAAQWEAQQVEWKAKQEEHVRKWDADGDGKLSATEHKAASDASIKEWREKNPEQAAKWDEQQAQWKKQQAEHIKKWDEDGDGELNAAEHKAATDHAVAVGRKQYEDYIKKWDTDGDGKLSPDESKVASEQAMRDWREKNPEQAAKWDKQQEEWKKQQEERVRKYDADGDGKLSPEEWREVMKAEREKNGGAGGFRPFGQ